MAVAVTSSSEPNETVGRQSPVKRGDAPPAASVGGEDTSRQWLPAFEGQRPPFAPGNTAAVTHGAWSPRVVEPIARQYLEAALSDDGVPYLRERRYRAALAAWAAAEARVVALEAWVAGMPIERAADAGAGRTAPLELLRKWEASAATHRDRLGLTPASAARLGRDVAMTRQLDTAAIMAEMHRREQQPGAAGGAES